MKLRFRPDGVESPGMGLDGGVPSSLCRLPSSKRRCNVDEVQHSVIGKAPGGGSLRSDPTSPAPPRPASTRGELLYGHTSSAPPSPLAALPPAHAVVLRTNTICPYYTMFPLSFPFEYLRCAEPGSLVLDPFCGRGTTNFAARLLGLPTIGVDSNPVAAAVAAAKLVDPRLEAVIGLCESILSEPDSSPKLPDGRFWDLCYHPDTLGQIVRIRNRLVRRCLTADEVALRGLMLGILHGPMSTQTPSYLSNQMPRTYATKPMSAVRYWETHGLTSPPRVSVLDVVARRARFVYAEPPLPASGDIYIGDSRYLHEFVIASKPIDWIITSPPYLGLRTYRPDQWLRNWFVGGSPDVDYSQDGQLQHRQDSFAAELARVWTSAAQLSRAGTQLVIRFGALPSVPVDLEKLLRESFADSHCSWSVLDVSDAGTASNGKRQSGQFGRSGAAPVREIDLRAVLRPSHINVPSTRS